MLLSSLFLILTQNDTNVKEKSRLLQLADFYIKTTLG